MRTPLSPTDAPGPLLDQHRRDIEALDRRILHLICERLELARQIGELKQTTGIPLRNFKVEAEVYSRFGEASRLLGLDEDLGRDLATFLISKAVEEQAVQRDTVYQGTRCAPWSSAVRVEWVDGSLDSSAVRATGSRSTIPIRKSPTLPRSRTSQPPHPRPI